MKITESCIINAMPEDAYHSDPCETPSLSSSMANALLEKTEEEAKIDSQRLNPNYKPRKSDPMDFGTIAHGYILLGERGTFEIAPFDSWRTKASKAAREDIESRGLIALNEKTASIFDIIKDMKDALRKQLDAHKDYPGLMMKGKPEQSAFAHDGDIWNRARFDWLDENYPDLIVDYKTTGIAFDNWEKNQLWGDGKVIQNPHYRKVYDLVTGKKSKFIWVVQQTKAPYHIKVFEIDDGYMGEVEKRYDLAISKFINCLKTDVWRGQPPYSFHSYPPPWIMQKWEMDNLNRASVEQAEAEQKDQPKDVYMAG